MGACGCLWAVEHRLSSDAAWSGLFSPAWACAVPMSFAHCVLCQKYLCIYRETCGVASDCALHIASFICIGPLNETAIVWINHEKCLWSPGGKKKISQRMRAAPVLIGRALISNELAWERAACCITQWEPRKLPTWASMSDPFGFMMMSHGDQLQLFFRILSRILENQRR